MNKPLSSFACRGLAVLSLLLCPCWLLAQGPAPIRPADFIVAVVNSEPVTNSEVLSMRRRLQRELAGSGALTLSETELSRQALEQLINQKVQLQEARDAGIRIDEDQIDQAEANVAASNRIGREALYQRLAQEGITPAEFRLQLKNQLMLARLREREVEARLRISDRDIDQFLREQGNTRPANTTPELNIAMILLPLRENSFPSEVKTQEDKARDIVRRARNGEDFALLARTYSQAMDKGARGGEMGLRPADRYPELFVEAVRKLPVDGISDPVRSDAGFHVLKLLERRQGGPSLTVAQTRVRHILLRPDARLTREQAIARLQQLRQQILAGRITFAQAAREQSQDGSAAEGGDLGWATPGQFVPEFEAEMNPLRPGQISEPLVSRFGVHLIEVIERRQVAVPEKEQREMARAMLREKRLDETYERWAEDLRGRAYVEMRDSVDPSVAR